MLNCSAKHMSIHDCSIRTFPAFERLVLILFQLHSKLLNMCLKESCFPDCRKVSSMVPVVKNVGERSTAKNYRPVSLLFVVSKVFEKLVNNRLIDHLKKWGLFLFPV